MKFLIYVIVILLASPMRAETLHSLKPYFVSGWGAEETITLKKPRGGDLNYMLGFGLSYALFFERYYRPIVSQIDFSAQMQMNLSTTIFVDFLVSFSVGRKTRAGYYMAELFGIGVSAIPQESQYEISQTTYPFSYSSGTLKTAWNIGLIVVLPGFNCLITSSATINLRTSINILMYDGVTKAAQEMGATAYDNVRWDIAFRIHLSVGFDFLSLFGVARSPRVSEDL